MDEAGGVGGGGVIAGAPPAAAAAAVAPVRVKASCWLLVLPAAAAAAPFEVTLLLLLTRLRVPRGCAVRVGIDGDHARRDGGGHEGAGSNGGCFVVCGRSFLFCSEDNPSALSALQWLRLEA